MIDFVGHIIYLYPKVQLYVDIFYSMVNIAFAAMKFYTHSLKCRMKTAICAVLGTEIGFVVVNIGCTSLHTYKEITYRD